MSYSLQQLGVASITDHVETQCRRVRRCGLDGLVRRPREDKRQRPVSPRAWRWAWDKKLQKLSVWPRCLAVAVFHLGAQYLQFWACQAGSRGVFGSCHAFILALPFCCHRVSMFFGTGHLLGSVFSAPTNPHQGCSLLALRCPALALSINKTHTIHLPEPSSKADQHSVREQLINRSTAPASESDSTTWRCGGLPLSLLSRDKDEPVDGPVCAEACRPRVGRCVFAAAAVYWRKASRS